MQKILNIRLNIDKETIPKAKYIFDLMLKVLGLKAKYYTKDTLDDIHIYYGVKTTESFPVKIYRDIITSLEFHKRKVFPENSINFIRYKNDYIPFLFSPVGDIFEVSSSGIIIRKDLISSAFYLLTDWEEYIGVSEREKIAVRQDFTHLPLLEIYADILKSAMLQTVIKQLMVLNPKNEKFYHLSLIFNKEHSLQKTDTKTRFKEIQKIEHYQRKFFRNRKQNHFSIISNDETYAKLFKNVVRGYNNFIINDVQNSNFTTENIYLYNFSENFNYQDLYLKLQKSGAKLVIGYYFSQKIGYRNLFSFPYSPFDFTNNKPFSFTVIPIAMLSKFFIDFCDKHRKFSEFEVERFFKYAIKYGANIFIGFDILEFYYKCPEKINLFIKLRKCVRKLRKSYMKPLSLEMLEKVISQS